MTCRFQDAVIITDYTMVTVNDEPNGTRQEAVVVLSFQGLKRLRERTESVRDEVK
jgi:hypothetical protein